MKKVLILFICFALIISNAVFVSATEDAEKILSDFVNNRADEIYPTDQKGIEDAFLADLDNDGVPELLCSRNTYFYGLSVYAVKDGDVVKVGDEIFFERGTGINEDLFLVTDTKGKLMFYREAIHNPQPGAELYTTQAVYAWNSGELTCIKNLRMTVNYGDNPEKTGFTTSISDENEVSLEKITKEEAREKFNSFKKEQMPYVVWEKYREENPGFSDIWNNQKAEISGNSKLMRSPAGKIVLQIGNPVMAVDGKAVKADADIKAVPVIREGRTLVPADEVVKAMGGYIIWDIYTDVNILVCNGKEIKLDFGAGKAYLDGTEQSIDVAPVIIGETAMIPVRFVAESFGFSVNWIQETSEVMITQ